MKVALCGLVISCGVFIAAAPPSDVVMVETETGVRCFAVEIADTHWSRAKGLMHRDTLGENEGMLFVYDAPRPVRFWMKNVRFPLDLIFVDDRGQVVKIVEAAEPGSIAPIVSDGVVNAVLEIRGGASKRAQIRPGDVMSLAVSDDERAHCPDKR